MQQFEENELIIARLETILHNIKRLQDTATTLKSEYESQNSYLAPDNHGYAQHDIIRFTGEIDMNIEKLWGQYRSALIPIVAGFKSTSPDPTINYNSYNPQWNGKKSERLLS